MSRITMKRSIIWMNIGELAVQNGKFNISVYKSAHFSAQIATSPQYPSISCD